MRHSEVLADIAALRSQLRGRGSEHLALLRLTPWRPLLDIAMDWVLVVASVHAVVVLGPWIAPAALVIIANRQRALGNILHDAGHRNLCRSPAAGRSAAVREPQWLPGIALQASPGARRPCR